MPVILLVIGLFAGIGINRRDFADLKADMNRRFNEGRVETQKQFDSVNREFDAVNREFATVHRRLDKMDEELKKRLDRIDSDLREFYGTDKQLEGRLNELSARIK